MLTKIISGGQTGADQGALDAAIKLGLPHGGWLPKGRPTEEGPLDEKYKLQEMPTASYSARTEKNVVDSDGTVILSHTEELSGGSKLIQDLARRHWKPCLHINLSEVPAFIASSEINTWVREHNIKVLNVGGPRASKDPDIYRDTYYVIQGTILLDLGDTRYGETLRD